MRGYALTELAPQFGTAIAGFDVSRPLTASIVAALLRVLDTRGVIVIRDQRLTADGFMDFARSLGELSAHPLNGHAHPDMPELMLHTNIVEHGKPLGYAGTERQWRMDGAQLSAPYRASVAYAVEVPVKDGKSLGATSFASTQAAYDALPSDQRSPLIGLRAVHPYGTGRKRRATPYFADSGLTQVFKKGAEHPVVRMHPITRQKCLYVSEACTSHICGLNDGDSAALLHGLYQHMKRAEFIYRHTWQAGDVVIWDNCAIQYRTDGDYELPLRRLMYRTQIKSA